MARNSLAGTKTGKSRSALYYQSHPDARAKKQAYDAKYGKTKKAIKKRSEDNKMRGMLGLKKGDKRDASKKVVNGKVKYMAEDMSKNRGSKTNSAGDVRARGSKLYS
jgi:hypothetical protein